MFFFFFFFSSRLQKSIGMKLVEGTGLSSQRFGVLSVRLSDGIHQHVIIQCCASACDRLSARPSV